MKIIDGKKIAQEILDDLRKEVAGSPFKPVLCDVLVGEDAVSESYIRIKGKRAKGIGIEFKLAKFDRDISRESLTAEIQKLNREKNICGLIVQLPLPPHLPRQEVLDAIDPLIDVDCLGETNAKKFYSGQPGLMPPTAAAIMAVLDSLKLEMAQKNILVIGQGDLVGKPVTYLLKKQNLQVSTAVKSTPNFKELVKAADIVISAAGSAGLVSGSMVKPGSVIIDAGTSESDGGITGDVNTESVAAVASAISPVPGGVGPVTVSMLLKNVVRVAAEKVV